MEETRVLPAATSLNLSHRPGGDLSLPQKYEYKVLRVLGKRPESLEADLNKFGADGWMVLYAGEALIILGRGLESSTSRPPMQPAERAP